MSWLKGRSKDTYASLRIQKPVARSEDLVIEQVEDEFLVYDAKNHRAHCLTSAAAKVWRACDGTKDVPALAESLALSVDDVTRALEMLDGVELLENQGLQIVTNGNGNGNGLTRRELGRRSAKIGAAAAAAPMLYSIAVPSPAAAATPTNKACALFSTFSCGTSSGAGAVAGCCCCCQAGGDCKVGGSTSTTNGCTSVTCPFGGGTGSCSSSCNPNGNPKCATTVGGTCCDVAATGPAGSSGCGCAFSTNGNTCGSSGASRPAGCAAGCTPGAASCGPGCCDAASCTTAVGGSKTNNATCSGCEPGSANCQPCCNGVLIDPQAPATTFGCCNNFGVNTPGTCAPLVT
jgi:hypothetical protein